MEKNSEAFFLIFEDGDPLRAEVIKAALEGAGIDCYIENEGVQNLFSLGSMGGLNPLMGTVKVYIRPEDREKAETLLAELQSKTEIENHDFAEDLPVEPGSEVSPPESKGFLSWFRQWFFK